MLVCLVLLLLSKFRFLMISKFYIKWLIVGFFGFGLLPGFPVDTLFEATRLPALSFENLDANSTFAAWLSALALNRSCAASSYPKAGTAFLPCSVTYEAVALGCSIETFDDTTSRLTTSADFLACFIVPGIPFGVAACLANWL